MSELFSWPTVIVGMGPPSVNGDPPAPGCGPGAGRFRLHVGTQTTLALRAARRTRGTPGPVPWCAAGRPLVTGTRVRPDRPADQGTGPGSVRVRMTSAERDRGGQDPKPYRPGLCRK